MGNFDSAPQNEDYNSIKVSEIFRFDSESDKAKQTLALWLLEASRRLLRLLNVENLSTLTYADTSEMDLEPADQVHIVPEDSTDHQLSLFPDKSTVRAELSNDAYPILSGMAKTITVFDLKNLFDAWIVELGFDRQTLIEEKIKEAHTD